MNTKFSVWENQGIFSARLKIIIIKIFYSILEWLVLNKWTEIVWAVIITDTSA